MRSIGARITFWYAISTTLSFLILSVIGGALLQERLTHVLDELNAAEFRQLRQHIGADYARLSPAEMAKRLEHVTEYESVLFYISIDYPHSEVSIFQSRNTRGQAIPDIRGRLPYTAYSPALGRLRVQEFALSPYDVTIATSARSVDDGLRAYAITSTALMIAMLIVSVAIGMGMKQLVLRPIRAIRETAERIRSDTLGERIPVSGVRDELDELAGLLNRTFDRLEEAFLHMRRFSEEVSHELKTPLSLLRLHAEAILRQSPDNADAAIEQIEEIERLNRFIDQMLFLSRAEASAISFDLQPVVPDAFLDSFAHDATVLAEHSGLRFEMERHGTGLVAMEPGWFRQVLLNILTNAIAMTPAGGLIRLIAAFDDAVWRLTVEDDGTGIPAEQLERIFDRFVRLPGQSAPTRGAGLGLPISRSIVRLHQGTIHAQAARRLKGLAIVITLPRVEPARPELAEIAPAVMRTQSNLNSN